MHRDCPEKENASSTPVCCNCQLTKGEKAHPANYRGCRHAKEPLKVIAFNANGISKQRSEHKRTISAVRRVEFVSDRMSYIILRGCWCHIIVLNVHAPTEDKTDDVKANFYEELERV
jgi:hypothetical protein